MQLCITILIACGCYLVGLLTGSMISHSPKRDIEETALSAVENTKIAYQNIENNTELNERFRIKFEQCLKTNQELNKRIWKKNSI